MFIELTSEEGNRFLVNLDFVSSIVVEDGGRSSILSVIAGEQRKETVLEGYQQVKEMVDAVQRY